MAESPQDLVTKYKDILALSNTAYSPGVAPTREDVSAEKSLRKSQAALDRERSEALKARWYGPKDETDEMGGSKKPERSTIGKVLHTMGIPLYGTVGAVEAALGKGTKKGLIDNMRANIEEEGTYGDLLRSYGAPGWGALPMGFAMDVALDPVTWATLGTGSLVPRVAVGLTKGGLTGARAAAVSRLGPSAHRFGGLASRAVRGRDPAKMAKEAAARTPTWMERVRKTSETAQKEWEVISGAEEKMLQGNTVSRALEQTGLGDKWADYRKTEQGKKVADFFEYSPMQWMKKQREELENKRAGLFDVDEAADPFAEMAAAGSGRGRSAIRGGGSADDYLEAIDVSMDPEMGRVRDSLKRSYAMMGEKENLSMRHDEVWKDIANLEKAIKSKDRAKMGRFIDLVDKDDGGERLEKFLTTFRTLKADVDGYDQWVAKTLLSSNKMETAMRGYAKFLFLFKTAKIGGGLVPGTPVGAVGTNSIIGNPAMANMAGVDVFNPRFMASLKDALDVTTGKDFNKTMEMFSDPATVRLMEREGDIIRSVVGVDPRFLLEGQEYIDKVHGLLVQAAKRQGKTGEADEALAFLNSLKDTIDSSYIEAAEKLIKKGAIKDINRVSQIKQDIDLYRRAAVKAKGAGKDVDTAVMVASRAQATRIAADVRSVVEQSLPGSGRTTFMAQEILSGEGGAMIRRMQERALETDNVFYKAASWYLTKPMDTFSKIDQTYKLGLFAHLKNNGITERELRLMAKRFKIGADDIVREGDMFRLTPEKSLDVANEVYMNYMAMPGFVKIMRNMPLLGAPFISFSYAATAQMAKAAVHNPAFFNKMQFALHEISGRKGPLEKEALGDKYYQWMDRPGMVKIPFFQDNPVYLNAENMLFHYSAGMLQDPERSYESRYGNAVVNAMDRMPFAMKEPGGKILMDYVILPTLLGESLGTFGQPLWPEDAGMTEKAGRAAVAAAETVVPGFAGYAGPLLPGAIPAALPFVPEGAMDYWPSYGGKQMAQAVRGRTTIGADSKEPAVQRTARVVARMLGFPLYYMNLSYQEKKE